MARPASPQATLTVRRYTRAESAAISSPLLPTTRPRCYRPVDHLDISLRCPYDMRRSTRPLMTIKGRHGPHNLPAHLVGHVEPACRYATISTSAPYVTQFLIQSAAGLVVC